MWEDGRTSQINPSSTTEKEVNLRDNVTIKWGRGKKNYPGRVIGIEEKSERNPPIQNPPSPSTQPTTTTKSRDNPVSGCGEICATCEGKLLMRTRTHECTEPTCTKKVHKQTKCSGLTRDQQRDGALWRCHDHGGTGPTPRTPTPLSTPACNPCLTYCTKFRANIIPLKCRTFAGEVHLACSGLVRRKAEKLRDNVNW